MEFNLRLVRPGDRYGRDLVLINYSGQVMVEFYDADYAGDPRFTDFGGEGQFVSRYYLETLDSDRSHLEAAGLDLDGGVPKWKLTGQQMREAFAQIDQQIGRNAA